MGRQPTKPNGKPISLGTKNRYESCQDNPRNQTRRRLPRTKGTLPTMERQPTKPNTKTIFRGTKTDTTERTTHENRHGDDLREPKGRYEPWKDNPRNRTRERFFEGQRTDTNGRITYENRHEDDDSENRRDVNNHGKTTHETKPENDFLGGQTIDTTHENGHEDDFRERYQPWEDNPRNQTRNDFSRDKESRRLKDQSTKTDTQTTFKNHITNGTFLFTGRQPTKPNTKPIFRKTKNRFAWKENPREQTRR